MLGCFIMDEGKKRCISPLQCNVAFFLLRNCRHGDFGNDVSVSAAAAHPLFHLFHTL